MNVHVTKNSRGKWVLRWTSNGRQTERSTGLSAIKSNYKSALKLAAELERELVGDLPPRLMIPQRQQFKVELPGDPDEERMDGEWEAYRKYFFEVHMSGLSPGYTAAMKAILDKFQRWAKLSHVSELTASKGRRWIAYLRAGDEDEEIKPLPATTIRSYWRHLTAFLSLAVDDGLIESIPKVRLPKVDTASLAKGRPLNLEEFERMKSAVMTVRKKDFDQFGFLLDGLWLSGLRIGEAYRLTWQESEFCLDMTGRPKFVISKQKNKKRQVLPMAPEFARALEKVSGMKRNGFVFKLTKTNGDRLSLRQVEKVVSAIGEKAGIRINDVKTATAHDLRRSFATRWAVKVLPQVLQKLMRHNDISTTMKYYADIDADLLADQLYEHEQKHEQEPNKKAKS